MGLFNIGTLFSVFVILLNAFESSHAQGLPFFPPPSTEIRNERPRFMIENHTVILLGNNPGTPVVIGDLFLGVFEGTQFRPVNHRNHLSILNIRELRYITVTESERTQLINRFNAGHNIRGE